MLKALYYPHTDVTNPLILKNALLLWDSLETIVPRSHWVPEQVKGDRLVNEAVDLIVRPRVPSAPERTEAHRVLAEIPPNVRIDVALGNNGKRGERVGKAHESATDGRV